MKVSITALLLASLATALPVDPSKRGLVKAPSAETSTAAEAQCWGKGCGAYPWKREDDISDRGLVKPAPATSSAAEGQCWGKGCGAYPWKREIDVEARAPEATVMAR